MCCCVSVSLSVFWSIALCVVCCCSGALCCVLCECELECVLEHCVVCCVCELECVLEHCHSGPCSTPLLPPHYPAAIGYWPLHYYYYTTTQPHNTPLHPSPQNELAKKSTSVYFQCWSLCWSLQTPWTYTFSYILWSCDTIWRILFSEEETNIIQFDCLSEAYFGLK